MKVSKDIRFLITCILFTTITALAGSFKKFITSGETLFPSIPRNRLNPFFVFTASNWRCESLWDYETIVNLISVTTTASLVNGKLKVVLFWYVICFYGAQRYINEGEPE